MGVPPGLQLNHQPRKGGKLMDYIDITLLRLLVRTGPIHTTGLARMLGVTEDEVRQRMGRLRDLGLVAYIVPEANA